MSDNYVFGKDITRRFYPTEADQPLSLPSQTPTIYIFSSQPTRTNAIAGTGAVQTISAWTQATISPFECTYTITAIADPDAASSTNSAIYWEAVKFITKTAGTTQTLLRAFILERTEGAESHPGTKAGDLIDIYPAIIAYLTSEQLDAHLRLAEDELKIDLESQGLKWSRMHNLQKLKLILAWKTIALSAESQIKALDDKFDRRANLYNAKYDRALKNLVVPYDSNGDGATDSNGLPFANYYIPER